MLASALFTALLTPALFADAAPVLRNEAKPPVTVFFQFDSPTSQATVRSMRTELDRLFASVPLRFDWLRMEEAPEAGVFGEAIVVRFKGNCSLTAMPPLPDERGPFAWASVTDGVVQPFAEVNCDRVRGAVHVGMWGAERAQAARFLGTALGRVVAHEVYHIYFRSRQHASGGVMHDSLTPQDLVAEKAELHPEDRSVRVPSPSGRD